MSALRNLPNIIKLPISGLVLKNSNRGVGYKSALSLDKLYPQSSLKLYTPEEQNSLGIKQTQDFDGFIPFDQLDVTYSRSSGPGGQNVNKVNTKVDVRFHLQSATWLSDKVKTKMLEKYGSKLTKEGQLVFRSDLTRSQQLNLADCLEKLRRHIREALFENPEPSPETQESIRKRIERANMKRLAMKRIQSQYKTEREVERF